MNTAAFALLATLALGSAAACSPPPSAAPEEPAGTREPAGNEEAAPAGASILDHARSLPELPMKDGAVSLPLQNDQPMVWRPIREGVTMTGGKELKAAYTRTRGQAAGAALVVKPGTLTGLKSVELAIAGNRSQTLYLNLKQADGSVWTLGPINVRTGEPRTIELRAEDIELDPYQNRGVSGATFDAASVYMVTLLDISGHMSLSEPECEWTVSSIKAVRR